MPDTRRRSRPPSCSATVPRVADEFECQERNSQRQERVRPIVSLRRAKPHQPGKKVAILENEEQDHRLRHSPPSRTTISAGKPAGNGFPKKNSRARRRNNSTQLGVGRIEEKAATAGNKSPAVGIAAGSNGIKLHWELEKKAVGPSTKHHLASVDSLHRRFLLFFARSSHEADICAISREARFYPVDFT
jgi:hypothetical protein